MRIGHVACWLALTACGAAGKAPETPREAPTTAPAPSASPPVSLVFGSEALSLDRQAVPAAEAVRVKVKPRNQGYKLPLPKKAVVNLERDVVAQGLVKAGSPELQRLLTHGMVIVPGAGRRFDQAYRDLEARNVPILVSADSVLHQQHILFNEILKAVELRALSPMLTALLSGLHAELAAEVKRNPRSEPAQNELALLSVARKLLDPSFQPEPAVAKRVDADLKLIAAHKGPGLSAAQSSALCLSSGGTAGRCYQEDFSQYVPRGHYTVSPELTRYFQAMMWLGRMGRRVAHDDEIVQQVLLVQAAKSAHASFEGHDVSAGELLARIAQILDFFVGASDDLTLPEVDGALRKKLAPGTSIAFSREVLNGLRDELKLLRAPRINSGAVETYGKDAAATLKGTQQLRLMGQRFAADSEMLGRLVFEHTGPDPEHARFAEVARSAASEDRNDWCLELAPAERAKLPSLTRTDPSPDAWRCLCERASVLSQEKGFSREEELDNRALTQVCRLMPSVLDVAAAMGSPLAERLVAPSRKYAGYDHELAALRESFRNAQGQAPSTLYEAWIGSIAPLLQPMPSAYPTWMTSTDYQKKSLRTFAASWTELRHDTILYVKQSYTTGRVMIDSGTFEIRPRPPEAYGVVEARPELYARLQALAKQTRLFLDSLSALPKEVGHALEDQEKVLERLTAINVRQLEGAGLTKEDEQYIKRIGDELLGITARLTQALTPPPPPPSTDPSLQPYQALNTRTEGLNEALLVPLVADVHTDLNTKRVLEEGTGPLEWMLAVTRLPDGSLSVSAGPVFSFKEFVHPLSDRLSNDKWRDEHQDGAALMDPRWWTDDRPFANGFELPSFDAPKARK